MERVKSVLSQLLILVIELFCLNSVVELTAPSIVR
jgi:hypothetical protein